MEKTNKKPIIITAILSIIFTLMLLLTIDSILYGDSDEYATSVEAIADNEPQIEIEDSDGIIENEIGEHFFSNMFLESASEDFQLESVRVAYNQKEFHSVILLTVTDESFGQFMSKYIHAENSDEYAKTVIDRLISSSEMLTSRLRGNVHIELTTPSMNNTIFVRIVNDELETSVTSHMFLD